MGAGSTSSLQSQMNVAETGYSPRALEETAGQ